MTRFFSRAAAPNDGFSAERKHERNLAVCDRRREGRTYKEIAAEFQFSPSMVTHIVKTTCPHVPPKHTDNQRQPISGGW
jgi:DNA-binding NarL/FixJ family response regulator